LTTPNRRPRCDAPGPGGPRPARRDGADVGGIDPRPQRPAAASRDAAPASSGNDRCCP